MKRDTRAAGARRVTLRTVGAPSPDGVRALAEFAVTQMLVALRTQALAIPSTLQRDRPVLGRKRHYSKA